MENMDKELTVPKWVQPKIPQMPAQAQKFEIFENLGVRSPCITPCSVINL